MVRTELALALALTLAVPGTAHAGSPDAFDNPVNLDGVGGAESLVQVYRSANAPNSSYPNVVCVGLINKVRNARYDFQWPRAGPGTFQGRTPPGSSAGTGRLWRWDTIGQVCANTCNPEDGDCLTWNNVDSPGVKHSLDVSGLTTTVCQGGPVPGQACITHAGCGAGGTCQPCGQAAHISDTSLVSSMHALFGAGSGLKGPGAEPADVTVELLRVESSVRPAAGGGFVTRTRVINLSNAIIGIDVADGSGFAEPTCAGSQIRCGDVCCDRGTCSLDLCDGLQCTSPTGCLPPSTACGDACVDTLFDERHCGACAGAGGVACAPPTGCCVDGTCVACPGQAQAVVLRGGEEAEVCQGSPHPAREAISALAAFCDPSERAPCKADGPGVRGMVNILVPDPGVTIPSDAPFLTPRDIELTDGSGGDGLAQPGETIALRVTLDNAGGQAVPAGAVATLSSPAVCDGGAAHGAACTADTECPGGRCPAPIAPATAVYESGVGAGPGPARGPVSDDCEQPTASLPSGVNTLPFSVAVPADHATNTTRMFEVSFRVCEGGGSHGAGCLADADCGTGSCRAICSDGAGTCAGNADCTAPATCVDPTARFPVGIRCCAPGPSRTSHTPPVGCGAVFEPPLHLALDKPVMVWSALSGTFDVVGGDLASLRAGGWLQQPQVQCLAANASRPFARFRRHCVGGSEAGRVCTVNAQCPGGTCQCLEGNTCLPDPAQSGSGLWFLIRSPGGSYGGPPERDQVLPDCN